MSRGALGSAGEPHPSGWGARRPIVGCPERLNPSQLRQREDACSPRATAARLAAGIGDAIGDEVLISVLQEVAGILVPASHTAPSPGAVAGRESAITL